MANAHERLKQKVADAIEDLFSDTSVGPTVTYDDMLEIKEDVDMKMESLDV